MSPWPHVDTTPALKRLVLQLLLLVRAFKKLKHNMNFHNSQVAVMCVRYLQSDVQQLWGGPCDFMRFTRRDTQGPCLTTQQKVKQSYDTAL